MCRCPRGMERLGWIHAHSDALVQDRGRSAPDGPSGSRSVRGGGPRGQALGEVIGAVDARELTHFRGGAHVENEQWADGGSNYLRDSPPILPMWVLLVLLHGGSQLAVVSGMLSAGTGVSDPTVHSFQVGLSIGVVPLLALWLTWRSGSWSLRLPWVLFTYGLFACITCLRVDQQRNFSIALAPLLLGLVILLGLNGLMLPVRDLCGWRLVHSRARLLRLPPMQWSLMHMVSWTVFLAAPLTLFQLYAEFADPWGRGVAARKEALAALLGTIVISIPIIALALAVLAEGWRWSWRALAVAVGALTSMTIGFGGTIFTRNPYASTAAYLWGFGLIASTFVNLFIIRAAGFKLRKLNRSDESH
jgi:hypothetical protein